MTLVCDSAQNGCRRDSLSDAHCGRRVVTVKLTPVGRLLIYQWVYLTHLDQAIRLGMMGNNQFQFFCLSEITSWESLHTGHCIKNSYKSYRNKNISFCTSFMCRKIIGVTLKCCWGERFPKEKRAFQPFVSLILAETRRFELPIQVLPRCSLSRGVPSTTRPRLRITSLN